MPASSRSASAAAKRTTSSMASAPPATASTSRSTKTTAAASGAAKASTAKKGAAKASDATAKRGAAKASAAKRGAAKASAAGKGAKSASRAAGKEAAAKRAAAASGSGGSKKPPAKKAAARSGGKRAPLDKFLEGQQKALLAERETYMRQAAALRAEADLLAEDMEPGDTDFGEEGGEGATIAVERERDLALSAQARAEIEDIDRALAKIQAGSYGVCEQCGETIPKERLKALPQAALCVRCKSGGFGRR